jgi:hypothetical protein
MSASGSPGFSAKNAYKARNSYTGVDNETVMLWQLLFLLKPPSPKELMR